MVFTLTFFNIRTLLEELWFIKKYIGCPSGLLNNSVSEGDFSVSLSSSMAVLSLSLILLGLTRVFRNCNISCMLLFCLHASDFKTRIMRPPHSKVCAPTHTVQQTRVAAQQKIWEPSDMSSLHYFWPIRGLHLVMWLVCNHWKKNVLLCFNEHSFRFI